MFLKGLSPKEKGISGCGIDFLFLARVWLHEFIPWRVENMICHLIFYTLMHMTGHINLKWRAFYKLHLSEFPCKWVPYFCRLPNLIRDDGDVIWCASVLSWSLLAHSLHLLFHKPLVDLKNEPHAPYLHIHVFHKLSSKSWWNWRYIPAQVHYTNYDECNTQMRWDIYQCLNSASLVASSILKIFLLLPTVVIQLG